MDLSPLIPLTLLALFAFGWLCRGRFREKSDVPSLLLMQQQIDHLRIQLSQSLENNARMIENQLGHWLGQLQERLKENGEILGQTQRSLGERLDNAAQVVGSVQRSLGGLEEANRKIYEVGRDIASLQEILRAPKLRGGLGEFLLEDLLGQILPPEHFSTQYSFRSGEKVDAVVKIGASLVPVDAKFPLDNFKRVLEASGDQERSRARRQFVVDVKKHVDAVAAKYILPDEGTYDFALMYIPAENVYYETIIREEAPDDRSLSHYALGKRVIPVSPNSFYAYLQAIALGLKGLKIEDHAKEIVAYLSRLQGDFEKFRDEFTLAGKHLSHTQASFQNAERRLDQFAQRLAAADTPPKKVPVAAEVAKLG